MPHRSIFKPMKDHPSLDEVMAAPSDCPHCIDERDCGQVATCNAISRAYAGDAKRVRDRVLDGEAREGRV